MNDRLESGCLAVQSNYGVLHPERSWVVLAAGGRVPPSAPFQALRIERSRRFGGPRRQRHGLCRGAAAGARVGRLWRYRGPGAEREAGDGRSESRLCAGSVGSRRDAGDPRRFARSEHALGAGPPRPRPPLCAEADRRRLSQPRPLQARGGTRPAGPAAIGDRSHGRGFLLPVVPPCLLPRPSLRDSDTRSAWRRMSSAGWPPRGRRFGSGWRSALRPCTSLGRDGFTHRRWSPAGRLPGRGRTAPAKRLGESERSSWGVRRRW